MTLSLETDHFLLRYSDRSTSLMGTYAAELERSYGRILGDLGLARLPQITGRFYPDQASFDAATGWVGEWGIVQGRGAFVVVAAPLRPFVPVHEFAHCATLHLNPRIANDPVWLWEAVALYESEMLFQPSTIPCLATRNFPTLAQLDQRGTPCSIYDVGYTIAELVVERWGLEALRQLIASNGDTRSVLGLSATEFEAAWYAFLEERYL